MSTSDTTGVTILSAMLKRLADTGTLQVAEFAAEEGFARATTFAVSRRLREHGFIVADPEDGLAPGPAMQQFAWAALGLAELAGPAEAVLRWLLDQIDGQVSLSIDGTTLIELGEVRQKNGEISDFVELKRVLRAPSGSSGLTLKLRLPPAQNVREAFAQRCLARAALTLETYLQQPG